MLHYARLHCCDENCASNSKPKFLSVASFRFAFSSKQANSCKDGTDSNTHDHRENGRLPIYLNGRRIRALQRKIQDCFRSKVGNCAEDHDTDTRLDKSVCGKISNDQKHYPGHQYQGYGDGKHQREISGNLHVPTNTDHHQEVCHRVCRHHGQTLTVSKILLYGPSAGNERRKTYRKSE